ncbi:MAG: hypothetical protein IJ867_01665 [Clostridia bacterium]|nr:hypothetical protein [Clostridia bacterium]
MLLDNVASTVLYEVTAESVAPVTTAISSALTNLMPIGLGVMATFIGIHMIKRIIYTFL